ncbi:MAG: DUF6933 domain-containing protein [Candidatus Sumerlaeaceae bacterium]
MLLRCTASLLKLLGYKPGRDGAHYEPTGPLEEWYANLLWLERRKCILFTNAQTLYSCVALDVRKAQLANLLQFFGATLAPVMLADGFTRDQVRQVLHSLGDLHLDRTASRSILGCMNDFTRAIQYRVDDLGLQYSDAVELGVRCNDTPIGGPNYKWPARELRALLANQRTSVTPES